MKVRRTIQIEISGDPDVVQQLAISVGREAFCDGRAHVKLTQREDFLDGNGQVIPAAEIVAACRAVKAQKETP